MIGHCRLAVPLPDAALLGHVRAGLFSRAQLFFVCQPKAMQHPADRRVIYDEAVAGLEVAHQRIECQVALNRNPLPESRRDICQLAAPGIALPLRIEGVRLAPQLDHVVHKARRDAEMACGLQVRITLISKRDDPLPQLHRMWFTHMMPRGRESRIGTIGNPESDQPRQALVDWQRCGALSDASHLSSRCR